jgi:hypothetical protein
VTTFTRTHRLRERSFDRNDLEGIRQELLRYADAEGRLSCPVLSSSSLLFPEDYGFEEGFDAVSHLRPLFDGGRTE